MSSRVPVPCYTPYWVSAQASYFNNKFRSKLCTCPAKPFSEANHDKGQKVGLTQSDFDQGTVRIRYPGLYVLQEDIVFDPNPDRRFSDPSPEQAEQYPPVVNGCGAYVLGFFAAITIETSCVVLDLNGYRIRQSQRHYLRQRFFSVIELASSPFIQNQGPACFADKPIASGSNVLIMNGTIGWSAHHGIHGNLSGYRVCLADLVVEDFEIAGISLHGGTKVVMTNVTIRNSLSVNGRVPVRASYSQSLFLARKVSTIPDTTSVLLNGQTGSVHLSSLMTALDSIEADLLAGRSVSAIVSDHPEWEMFLSASGQSDGQNYGLLLAPRGVAVGSLPEGNPTPENNQLFYLRRVTIENIESTPQEIIGLTTNSDDPDLRMTYGKLAAVDAIGAVIDTNAIQTSSGTYSQQNLLSNLQFWHAKYRISEGETPSIPVDLISWVESSDTFADLMSAHSEYELTEGIDSMAHVMKGTFGLLKILADHVYLLEVKVSGIRNLSPVVKPFQRSVGLGCHSCMNIKGFPQIENIVSVNGESYDRVVS